MICVQSVIRLKKETNFKGTFPFRGCVEGGGGGGCVRTSETLGGGTTFVWLIHGRLRVVYL